MTPPPTSGRSSTCPKPPPREVNANAPRDGYDEAFNFWRLLAEIYTPLGQSKALLNTAAPIVLSNALWYPEPESIAEAHDFYSEQNVLPSCFLSAELDKKLYQTLALSNAGFSRTAQYDFVPITGAKPATLAVEQVSWAQTRTLGEVIAAKHALSPYAVAVGQSLALAMQLEPTLTAFAAYDGRPVGAMVVRELADTLTAFVLESLTPEAETALRARLHFEARTRGEDTFVFEQVEMGAFELWQ